MKRKILSIIFLLGVVVASEAQMYVSPNSYVYVNDQYVYVAQDVNLANNGNFYLRNRSQLLQGTTGSGANTGLGNLSVFQEGTSDNFRYNYWCSPVGEPSGTTANSNFGITLLSRPTGLTTSAAATILPFGSYDGIANPLAIAQRWIYTFSASSTYSQWNFVGAATNVAPGLGFTMKGTSGTDATIVDANDGVQNNTGSAQRYDFRGKPNDGTITNAVTANNYTLVGNPYPSSIDLNLFLLDPSNAAVIDGRALFWEQHSTSHYITDYNGGYGVYTPGVGYAEAPFWNYDAAGNYETNLMFLGAIYERRFSPVGQGFMVRGTANGNVTMRNSFRNFVKEAVANQSEFAKTSSASTTTPNNDYFDEIPNIAGIDYTQIKKGFVPQLRINAVFDDNVVNATILGFDDNATDGFDYGFDGRSASASAPIGFYYILDQNPHEYVIDVVQFDIDKKIPVGFRTNTTTQTNFKVQVADVLFGFDENQEVFMHDIVNDIYYDIKNSFFDVTLPAGNYTTQYEITFKNANNTLAEENNSIANSFQVYQNNTTEMLTIVNTLSKDVVNLDVYDVTGKRVVNKLSLGSSNLIEVPTSHLSDGIYIVKLKTKDNYSIDKKVSVFKR